MNRTTEITQLSKASTVLTLQNVSMVSGSVARLQNVSLEIPLGRTAVIGHSGAGKSSLLGIVAGLEAATSGRIHLGDQASTFRLPLFWAPQDNGLWPHLTVRQHLTAVTGSAETSPTETSPATVRSAKEKDSLLDKSLQAFDLIHRQTSYPGQLSRGEQNRLAVLRCLLANPALILLDEPLIHVDPNRQPKYWAAIEDHLTESSASLIFATHQPEIAVAHSDYCLCLNEGTVDWFGATRDLYDEAPDQRTAEYLGPNNWFNKDEVRAIFGLESEFISCRPEQLRLAKCDTSDLQIVGTTFSGSYAVTMLRHVPKLPHVHSDIQKEVIHRPHANVFEAGQFVSLETLSS